MKIRQKVRPIGIALALLASIGIMSQQVRADGTTWTSRTAPEANSWNSIAYGNGTFVAVSNSGTNRVMTSPDGVTWTSQAAAEANSWLGVTFGNGIFVAVAGTGTNRVMTSPDGITWTPRNIGTGTPKNVTYGGPTGQELFVAVGDAGGNNNNAFYTSPDGITWTPQSAASPFGWSSVAWGNNTFVAVATSPSSVFVMTSPNGTDWTNRTGANTRGWSDITFGGPTGQEVFVAVTSANAQASVMTSPDGITWTPQTPSAENSWRSVTYGDGLFAAVSSDGTNRVMTSPDGVTWTSRTEAEANRWTDITFANGIFVAVSSDGTNRVMTSGTFVAPTTTTPTTTTLAPSAIPGVTVTDTKIYSRPPARVAAESSINVLTRAQNRTSDISTRTPSVCLPNDDELVFIDTGRCIADVVNTKTRRVIRTLRTTVIESEVSELNVGNEIAILAPIYFENGSSTLNIKAKRTLKNLTEQISAAGSVLVVGHSGTRNGNSPENVALSQARAQSTVAELRQMKAKGPFSVSGVGALDPARSARTEKAQAQNRRVVVVLIP